MRPEGRSMYPEPRQHYASAHREVRRVWPHISAAGVAATLGVGGTWILPHTVLSSVCELALMALSASLLTIAVLDP